MTYYVYDEANRCALTYDLLESATPVNSNTAMVSHAGFVCPVLDQLAWGETAIFKPDGAGSTTLVGRVLWDGWMNLP
ncbi:MAG: hypothetical protein IPK82_28200 [Polyangiaceae bacterium]|nr:hypothetical protein [Polyangiaceae bacterium]